jgi:UDP-N-acetylglucosamine 2-epimerase
MKILSIIGTRPQYIKVKPIYDYCLTHNIDHEIIDTNQHYSESVSSNIIKGLGLIISKNINATGETEVEFIADAANKIEKLLSQYKKEDIFVLIYGDTNSSFAAALACYKNEIRCAHIESGIRSGNNKIPEEINRLYIDSIADINFCTNDNDLTNVNNGILTGDLEYELLNHMNIERAESDFGLMTIHRQSNVNIDSIQRIFKFCENLGRIVFPIHHRLKSQKWFKSISIPSNIEIVDPLNYHTMVNAMASCKFILTDSGGVLKTSPFFGKRTLILRQEVGWINVINSGYAKLCNFTESDLSWVLSGPLPQSDSFYLHEVLPSEIIINSVLNYEK